MFILRAAFWLTVGFLLVAPHGTDLGATATALKDQAVEAGIEAGKDLVVSQITTSARLPDLLVSVAHASLDTTYVVTPTVATVLPRPRPAALS
jgi:hypothetical protein